jgi:hypothetical protein
VGWAGGCLGGRCAAGPLPSPGLPASPGQRQTLWFLLVSQPRHILLAPPASYPHLPPLQPWCRPGVVSYRRFAGGPIILPFTAASVMNRWAQVYDSMTTDVRWGAWSLLLGVLCCCCCRCVVPREQCGWQLPVAGVKPAGLPLPGPLPLPRSLPLAPLPPPVHPFCGTDACPSHYACLLASAPPTCLPACLQGL